MEEEGLRNPGNGGGEGRGYRGNNKENTGMYRRRRRNETILEINEEILMMLTKIRMRIYE